MNDILNNRLNMICSCIKLAESDEHRPAWEGQPPVAFGTNLAALKTGYNGATGIAAQAAAATTGAADEKAGAETAIEDLAFTLARAVASHLKKTGDLTTMAKVDFTKSAIVRLREQALTDTATVIRDTAQSVQAQPGAADRGVTAARVAALTAAIARFERLRSAPRAGIVSRSALLSELKTRVAGLMDSIADLDDLVIQFDTSEGAHRFIAAWKQARIIIDAGHGPGDDEPEEGGTTPPATPAA